MRSLHNPSESPMVARVAGWFRGPVPDTAAIPGWLPETIPTPLPGLRAGLVFAAALAAGLQDLIPLKGESMLAVAGVVMLYALSFLAALLVRLTPSRHMVRLGIGIAIALGGALELTFASFLGTVGLAILALLVVYHLPTAWSLPALAVIGAVLAVTVVGHAVLFPRVAGAHTDVPRILVVLVTCIAFAATLRSRSTYVLRLQLAQTALQREMERLRVTQAQLEAEMERTAEYAAARERTRIARDMHDVLAHSLTVLSIQTQAVRQIVTRDPRRAVHMLDEMASVVHESIAESRRVVGALRVATLASGDHSPLVGRLHALADRFAARTGLQCAVEERGEPGLLGESQEEALQYALQEALTNAYRHGSARHMWAEVQWQPAAVMLTVRDDGVSPLSDLTSPATAGSGHGLRGMRERAGSLGGVAQAGPLEEGGFAVLVSLPLSHSTPDPAEDR